MVPLLWQVVPASAPAWERPCARCAHGALAPTSRFRVNSNGSLHDVWLLYECPVCGAHQKRSVHRRIRERVRSLECYRRNDPDAAALCALHLARGQKLAFDVLGPRPAACGSWRVAVAQPFPCRARWDALLARALDASRSRVRAAWRVDAGACAPRFGARDLVPAAGRLAIELDAGRLVRVTDW